jgi:RimJ/RimL family protein N-acetyltransferase
MYKALSCQEYCSDNFSIIPIRLEDRFLIMKWRNEQMYHLRQNVQLNEEKQNWYFENVISNNFLEESPNQILFSFLLNGEFVGYGGLVHINWFYKNAEISFLMNTELENNYFEDYWINFLSLIEKVAFNNLSFKKIYTSAYDLRPRLYKALEFSGFNLEARLKNHTFISGKFIDIVIHSKFNE